MRVGEDGEDGERWGVGEDGKGWVDGGRWGWK